ncbi:MAG: tetratricopeptide repeat protein [Deltaproteobacteria bacterium]|nr:MAG: tetratricopeptide repeat protein [Deltaproteobacteria bacterium]
MDFSSANPLYLPLIFSLLGLFLGWLISSLFSRRRGGSAREKEGKEKKAYLKGVDYILSDDPDQAIKEFTKAVQINSDTVETYLTLGNLFRSKGEVSRAIRIHQSIISRPGLDEKTRLQALYGLGLDFKKAGFILRAISAFEEVISHDPVFLDAYIQLEDLFEKSKEWEKALATQLKINRLKRSKDGNNILAHLQTEIGKEFFQSGEYAKAGKNYKKALSFDEHCVDTYLHLGDLYFSQDRIQRAIATWKKAIKVEPSLSHLTYHRFEEAYLRLEEPNLLEDLLRECISRNYQDIQAHLALAKHLRRKGSVVEATRELEAVVAIDPHCIEARKELGTTLLEMGKEAEALKEYQGLLGTITLPTKNFQCNKCGYESGEMLWKCPQCLTWDTIGLKNSYS